MMFHMMFFPFGTLLSLIVPFVFIFFGVRILRRIFFSSSRDVDTSYRSQRRNYPYDELEENYYSVRRIPNVSHAQIFQLAKKLRGRITLSDIVIETGMSLHEAERVIESIVDGTHVSMEVNEHGRVVYEFPEIIERFDNESK